ncbi:hypothetical protein BGX33_001802 [Mortierella sp. NVP41]|nr:hypothetical protein BGX33_001802 [Mortierella sp. NVP41]
MQGGSTNSLVSSTQFYSLDLTQDWETSSPPWKSLKYPDSLATAYLTYRHSLSVSPDNKVLTIWGPGMPAGFVANYNIQDDTWTPVTPIPAQMNTPSRSMQAATDPTTGLVYIPGGYNNVSMAVYSFETKEFSPAPMPPGMNVEQRYYAFVWSQPTFGLTPPYQVKSCMVPAYNGTKMMFFGGNPPSGSSSADLWILDLPTMVWTQVRSAPSREKRSEMACFVSGDNFIVWGGYQSDPPAKNTPMSTTPLIYNIDERVWTTKYERENHYRPPESDDDAMSKGAAIGGGVAAGVVVVAGIAFLFVRRRRRQQSQQRGLDSTKEHESALHSDQILSSMEKASDGPGGAYNNPQHVPMDYTRSPHAPMNPPQLDHIDTVGSLDYDPSERPTELRVRGPQGVGEPVVMTMSSNHEMQQQINSLQAELKELRAKLDA